MIDSAARQIGETLRARGVDPAVFLSDGVEAVRILAGDDEAGAIEVLGLLEHFAKQLADRGIALWTPFHFGVRPIAMVAAHDYLLFASLLSDLWRLIDALAERSMDVELPLQQGVAVAARAENAGETLGPLLRMAARIAAKGLDPKETLRHGPSFAMAIDAVESFLVAMEETGVGPYFPILSGVAAIAEASRGDRHAFTDALADLASTVASLSLAGISPYPVVEHGVAPAFRAAAHASWITAGILPLAGSIAAHGKNPLELLARGIPVLASLDESIALPVLVAVAKAAEEGIDPAPVLHSFVPLLLSYDRETAARLTAEACALVGALGAHLPLLAFDEGFAQLFGRADVPLIERALRIARAIAESGANPGPALKLGLVSAVVRFQSEPVLLDGILDAAEKEAEEGIDPWALLEWGSAAIASVTGDEAERLELIGRLDSLVRTLAELGADVRAVLLYTVHQPARSIRDRALVIGLIDRIGGAIRSLSEHGIDPTRTMVHGIPRAAEAAPHAMEQMFRLIDALAARRVDPAPLLLALPALSALDLEPMIDRLLRAVDARPNDAGTLAAAIEEIGRAAGDRSHVVASSLEAIARLTWDGSAAIAAIVREIVGFGEETFARLLATAEQMLAQPLAAKGLSYVARAAGGKPEALADAMAVWRRSADRPLIEWGALAASQIAPGDARLFEQVLERFVRTTEGTDAAKLEPVLGAVLRSIADLSRDDPEVFSSLLERAVRLASSPGSLDAVLEHAMQVVAMASRTAEAYGEALEDLIRLRTSGAIERFEREIWYGVSRLRSLVEREPSLWRELLVPVIRSQGPGASSVLAGVARLGRWIEGPEAIALLRTIATQEGVRAPDLVHGFLVEALAAGAIRSLGQERELILAFLRDVPIAHPDYYRRYREILADETKPAAERRSQIEALHAGARALVGAIVRGEVTSHQAADPLFADALYYVFPPAYTVQRQAYAAIYHALDDHPEHAQMEAAFELSIGGYAVREGESIDRAPWELLREAVVAVHRGDLTEVGDLGALLLEAWVEGKIGQAETKVDLLRRIYLHHRITNRELPEKLSAASDLLAHREFLADTAKEIIQDALRDLRLREPERYRQRVQGKLSRRARVGTGLVRAVWCTIAAHREGTIDAETAIERLVRQLHGFDLSSDRTRLSLLAIDREDLEPLLHDLERSVREVEPGEEHMRVLGDLAGAELAAMQRELEAKLEYRRTEGGRTTPIRMQVTKRKAHAPIGYCEGVCTASDQRLWDEARFFQVIFWGHDDRARGGMHLLIVEVDRVRHLALPGINPSLSLLSEVGPDAMLDAVVSFARQLCERWNLAGILIPTHRGIMTNRGPIREAIESRGFAERAFASVQFSYRPYSYAFDRAFEVV